MNSTNTFTGFYLNIADTDHLWIANTRTGEIIRQAPAFLRDEAEWQAQQTEQEAA